MPRILCRWIHGLILLIPIIADAAPLPTPGDRDLQRGRQEQLLQEQQERLDELQNLPGSTKSTPSPGLRTRPNMSKGLFAVLSC